MKILFAEGFQTISDIEFHDDVMYVVSIFDGSIYKIYKPTEMEVNKTAQDTILTLILVVTAIIVALGITIGVIRRKRISS